VSSAEAEQVFFHDLLLVVVADTRHSGDEARCHALGRTDAGRLLHATFTVRREGRLIRVISARDVSRRERMGHAEEA